MMEDWWAHHFIENPKALETVEDEDFDLQAELDKLEREAEAGDGDWVDL